MPTREEPMVVVLEESRIPLVERLVHHQEPKLVAEVVESGRMPVMAHADRIAADFLQL